MNPARAHLAALFEGAPRFLDRLEAAAPFSDDGDLFRTARQIAHEMPEAEQVELIDAHPRLGAPRAAVSALSYVEQGYDRDAAAARDDDPARDPTRDPARDPDPDLATELERLNDAYEARFGFRYCVFVAGRPRAALLPGLAAALLAERRDEIRRALDAVVDIAMDRHAKLSGDNPEPPPPAGERP